ncbi:NO-inducible flavohemoprotein [Herbaspirillum sp. RTI4]|uniref:NO-inducible flavohemoprotein n=1 Tax=Herbaspirillum sp. RTI4 TaxID=3048640 RepID=UPI002AB3E0BF|nr:NO-inducible flavohemoprotein [Herbaspirillum sp. RTI4]MDY7578911.1 NO-inducible flavohemoprotein [Herbaspirillum sp. RTI4]MEA9982000.1 NO-inducible flavohemoprotein [Herbaspirillum sp. RTI4]
MLTDTQRSIVKSTVPLLESGGEALTTHFYRMLMKDYPEVLPLFNKAHQATGEQPRALANGILMYARHIDQLEQLGGLVSTIINKHVALQILPEHYPMVGDCLLRSIREVLGAEIATEQVLGAWGEAYQQLADILIGAEKKIYDDKATAPGGWRGGRKFTVVRKQRESDEITSFYLQPADGQGLADFEPGQFIGMRVVINGEEMRRTYSLSMAMNGKQYRISVKREPDGKVSNYLHDAIHEQGTLEMFPPAGDFTLTAGTKPLVLVSGGVGITPMMAMLEAALPTKRPLYFIHSARHGGVHAFRDHLKELAKRHPQLQLFFCYGEVKGGYAKPDAVGHLNKELLISCLPQDRDVDAYFVGPKPFMKAIKRYLGEIGVPAQQSHFEFFGPASALD